MELEDIVLENLALRDKCAEQADALADAAKECSRLREERDLWHANYELARQLGAMQSPTFAVPAPTPAALEPPSCK